MQLSPAKGRGLIQVNRSLGPMILALSAVLAAAACDSAQNSAIQVPVPGAGLGALTVDAGKDQLGSHPEGTTATLRWATFGADGLAEWLTRADDPNGTLAASGLTASVDWGDGARSKGTLLWNRKHQTGVIEADHLYAQDGRYEVTVTLGRGKVVLDSDSLVLRIANAPPRLRQPKTRVEGNTLHLDEIRYVDLGRRDTHEATVSWGDGAEGSATVVPAKTGGQGAVQAEHTYSKGGRFMVTVSVRDSDGGQARHRFSVEIGDPLEVTAANKHPTRLAWGPAGAKLYVTDALAHSLFIYRYAGGALSLIGQLKGLAKPLGVAVDAQRIYVGNALRKNVEIYDHSGKSMGKIQGNFHFLMPNDLALDAAGNLYVLDSRGKRVSIFDPQGVRVRTIGPTYLRNGSTGRFKFPISLALKGIELYVADQPTYQVQVFERSSGSFIRAFGGKSSGHGMPGGFVTLQAIAFDGGGWLHALDVQQVTVQKYNATTGLPDWNGSYGAYGSGPGQLRLPLDIAVHPTGIVAVADPANARVTLHVP